MVETIVVEEAQESLSCLALEESAHALRRHLHKFSNVFKCYTVHVVLVDVANDFCYSLAVCLDVDSLVPDRSYEGIFAGYGKFIKNLEKEESPFYAACLRKGEKSL